MQITLEDVKHNRAVNAYIEKADESLIALGYTEHSYPHVLKVADTASKILLKLGHSERDAELARIAGYLHDIGNVINRVDHAQSGAVMAFRLLDNMGADPDDIATIITAIGNHDESTGGAKDPVSAALILAVGQFASEVIPTGAWGLSFPSAGAAPNGPTSRETLREYDAAYVGSPEEKVLYLTFDAGYENGNIASFPTPTRVTIAIEFSGTNFVADFDSPVLEIYFFGTTSKS